MIEGMKPQERTALTAANGDWLASLPGKAPMGFGDFLPLRFVLIMAASATRAGSPVME
ncbi:MAG: hypothetical protein L0I29_07710 [Hyphomicrobiales bacterium]|nr:hypothetical protein [Hyphomicrobiales bacterium]